MKKFTAFLLAGLLAFGPAFAAPVNPDSYDSLFAKANGTTTTFVDSSTVNPKIITAHGNATQLSIPAAFNDKRTAMFFNGTTDYVTVPDSTDWDFGTGDYEVQFYFNMTSVPTSCYFLDVNSAAFAIYYNSGHFYVAQATNSRIDYMWTPTVNTWYKIKVKRVSGVTTLYKDDIAVGTPYTGSDDIQGGTTGYTIGSSTAHGAGSFFSGWLKNLTITKAGTTVLDMRGDSPATSPLGPAIYFDGTGDYLTVPDTSDLNFGTGAFTLDISARFDEASTERCLMSKRSAGTGWAWAVDNGKLYFYNGAANKNVSFTRVANVWYAFRVVRTGNTLRFFVNGVQVGADQDVTGVNYDGDAVTCKIGADVAGATSLMLGSFREARISNVARDSASSYTPSQSGFTVDANTKLYIKGNENNGVTTFVDSETSPKTVTTNGNTVIKYTEDYRSCIFKDEQGKFPYPQGSAKIDFFSAFGSGVYYGIAGTDYASALDSDDWNLGTDPYTIEAFFRANTSFSEIRALVDMNNGIGGGAGITVTIASGGISLGQYSGSANKMVACDTILPNTWYHMAIARTGTALKYFLNGSKTSIDPAANSDNIQNGTALCKIGSNGATYFWSGLMDNIRISKGTARYTATFNPPEDYQDTASGKHRMFVVM